MRSLIFSLTMMLAFCAQAYGQDEDVQDSLDNFQPPAMSSPLSTPLEQPFAPDPATSGYAPGVNVQTIPTPLQQTGAQQQHYVAAPLTVDTDLNLTNLMTDEVTLQYEYFYQDAAVMPSRQDAQVLANGSQDQSVSIPRFSDVIYLALFIQPAGMGPVACLPSGSVSSSSIVAPQLHRQEVLGKVVPEVSRVQVIGTSDTNGNVQCLLVIEQ